MKKLFIVRQKEPPPLPSYEFEYRLLRYCGEHGYYLTKGYDGRWYNVFKAKEDRR